MTSRYVEGPAELPPHSSVRVLAPLIVAVQRADRALDQAEERLAEAIAIVTSHYQPCVDAAKRERAACRMTLADALARELEIADAEAG